MALTDWLDRRRGWDRLPPPLGVLTLIGIRNRLRQRNLTNTELPPPSVELIEKAADPTYRSHRSLDGTINDLGSPRMGSIGTRFGRNVQPHEAIREPDGALLDPNPRMISRELLTRERFLPATTLNVLAAAWIQFEVHDWFSHGKNDEQNPWELALAEDDDWPERPMAIPRTSRDPTSDQDPGTPDTFLTYDSHWWDGSQIYGSDEVFAAAARCEDGKLCIDEDGLPPRELEQAARSGRPEVATNFWVGLALLHTLFTLEHNAICDRLRHEHPGLTDDQLYHKARLINAALMAKIHTTEWTPAIIAHPTSKYAMRATWSGIVGEHLGRRLGHLGSGTLLSGIPGSKTDHHGVPYSLTEEFVAVYRMHPLVPDEFCFSSVAGGELLEKRTFPELGAEHARERLNEIGVANALYSFGIAHPGEISLHNYPRFLQHLERNGTHLDLAATDILRIRERGVPRYNQFRRLFRLKPAESFAELTDNPVEADRIRRAYDGEIERVDLMIGLYAEPKPKGFGFSDTAFRVFILMASRRLESDRFFTRDYTAETYTQAGLDWINDSSMVSVLLRHYPSLAPALRGKKNAFAPWNLVG